MAHKYKQLDIEDREAIQQGLWEERSLRDIARILGRDASTISREIERNGGVERMTYAPRMAHEDRRLGHNKPETVTGVTRQYGPRVRGVKGTPCDQPA